MAKKKDNFDLDDFDLDGFDFDIPDFEDEEVNEKSRKPYERAMRGGLEGAKDELLTTSSLKQAVSMALPSGYGLGIDSISSAWDEAGNIYDDTIGNSPEIISKSKSLGRKLLSSGAGKVLPQRIADKLERALEEDTSSVKSDAQHRKEQEEAEIAKLTEIFRAKSAAEEIRAKESDIEGKESKVLEQQRFKTNFGVMQDINYSLARLVGYQDNVTAKYQQKMLELNYRQMSLTKQLVDIVAVSTQKHEKLLDRIRHNTMLPEAQKIRQSELFAHTIKQRLADRGANTLSNFTKGWAGQVSSNIKEYVGGAVEGFRGAGAETEDMDKAELGGRVLGGSIAAKARDLAAHHVSPLLAKNKRIASVGEKLRTTFTGMPQKVNEFAQSTTERTGWKGAVSEALKLFLPKYNLDSSAGGTKLDELDQPAVYDQMARRSLVEIIPGHLSEIARWTKAMATGQIEEKQVYNHARGGFSSESEHKADIRRNVVSSSERDTLRTSLDDFTAKIGADRLSPGAKRALTRKLLEDLSSGRTLDPKRLVDYSEYQNVKPDHVDEIVELISDVFGLDFEGNMDKSDTQTAAKFNDTAESFYQMSSQVPDIGGRIRAYGDVTGREVMRQLGLVVKDGREDRISYDKAWDMILDEGGYDDGTDLKPTDPVRLTNILGQPMSEVKGGVGGPSGKGRRRSGSGLEHYLGDKSTLIGILTTSRDYHEKTVSLLEEMKDCCCSADKYRKTKGSASDLQSSEDGLEDATNAGENGKLFSLETKAVQKVAELKNLVKDLREQGMDHPMLEEAEFFIREVGNSVSTKSRRLYDKAMDKVDGHAKVDKIKAWSTTGKVGEYRNEISNRASSAYDQSRSYIDDSYMSYQEFMERTQGMSAKDRARTLYEEADVEGRMDSAKTRISGMVDALPGQISAAKDSLTAKINPKVRNRFKGVMKRLTGGKVGSDVSSEMTGNYEQDMLTLSLRNAQLQWNILDAVTPEKIRKGSFQDIFSRRKNGEEEGKEGSGKDKDSKESEATKGILGSLMSMLGIEGNPLEAIMDYGIDIFDSMTGREKRKRRRKGRRGDRGNRSRRRGRNNRSPRGRNPRTRGRTPRPGGKTLRAGRMGRMGRVGRVFSGVKGLGSRILGSGGGKVATQVGKKGLMRGALSWGARIGAGALLGAAAPVVGTILTIATVATVAWAGYKFLKGRKMAPPLTRVRLAQYGVVPRGSNDKVKTLLALEDLASKNTSVDGQGKATVNIKDFDIKALAEIFSLKLDNSEEDMEKFAKLKSYLEGRFATVYARWAAEMHTAKKKLDLTKIDEEIVEAEAVEFLDKVALADQAAIFDNLEGPFDKPLDYDSTQVAKMVADAKAELEKNVKKSENKSLFDKAPTMAKVAMFALPPVALAAKLLPAKWFSKDKSKEAAAGAAGAAAAAVAADAMAKDGKLDDKSNSVVGKGRLADSMGAPVLEKVPNMEPGAGIRYRIYGLTEMDESKVLQLTSLERILWKDVRYSNDGEAYLDGVSSNHIEDRVSAIFNPVGMAALYKMKGWFRKRFLTAFLEYCTQVRSRSPIDAQDAAARLSIQDLVDVLKGMSNAKHGEKPVWELSESPWEGYTLNSNPESVLDPLASLSSLTRGKLLQEPGGRRKGRVKDKDGNWVEVDETQDAAARKESESIQKDLAQGVSKSAGAFGATAAGDGESKGGIVSGIKNFFGKWFGGGKTEQVGGIDPSTGQPMMPSGPGVPLESSIPISHPGGGTGGDINAIPLPQGDGWDANKATILTAANMVGVDPNLAASIAGVESNYRPNARPWKNSKDKSKGTLSSAVGYYQIIKDTWNGLMEKYASKYGIAPNTPASDPRANALMGLEYIRENVNAVKSVVGGRPVAATDVYLAHFLGTGGAKRFLKAPTNAAALNHVETNQANSNPSIFRPGGRVASVADVYNDFDRKLARHSKSDATPIAAQLSGMPLPPPPSTATEEVVEGSDSFVGPMQDGAPSMVRPTEGVVTPESPAEQAASEDHAAAADARVAMDSSSQLAVSARMAEMQTANHTSSMSSSGMSDTHLNRLVGINESQLVQLTTLVELLRSGVSAGDGLKNGVSDTVAETTPTQAPRRSRSDEIRLPNLSISVGRV